MQIAEFQIVGLFGDRDIKLSFDDRVMILVGPNGLGKSSVASIFYLTVSRQWQRLLNYQFEEISLTIANKTFILKRTDISGLIEFQKLVGNAFSPRLSASVNRLVRDGLLEKFLTLERLSVADRKKYSMILDMSAAEIPAFRRHLVNRLSRDEDLFPTPRVLLEKQLADAITSRVLYLPTYRRIEKDVGDIFPEFEERYRRLSGQEGTLEAGRSGNYYTELVSFGMEDVRKNIFKITHVLRDYSLSQYNNLSGIYLRDVIRGQAADYPSDEINSLTDADITRILDRVNEVAISADDKRLLRRKIQAIQKKTKEKTEIEERYLAHYFARLVAVTNDIRNREQRITAFIDVTNGYLNPSKSVVYDEIGFSLNIFNDRGSKIDLSMLSSGEKQIVSLFSHLYLDEARNQIVVIDEPELSLSVPWQKRFLTDILASDPDSFMLAVTHSPFVYSNSLKPFAVDLKKLTLRRDE